MRTIAKTMTLGEVVTAHPSLARELERLDLDYCCGGRRTIDTACTEAGLDAESVVAELERNAGEPTAPAWATMSVAELVDHIEAVHHRYLWDELPRLDALVDKIVGVHGRNHPELADVQRCFAALRAELEPHLRKEEQVLFPMIRELATAASLPAFHCGSVANPISRMLAEHDTAGELLARLRVLTEGYTPPADGCASYRACYAGLAEVDADTRLHIHKENNVVFPAVLEMERTLARGTA
jgi:regulator of cell morphogenesis and NO signaling